MGFLKKYCNPVANSILESIIALTIICICLYIAILIFATVFTPRTSARFYNTQNNVNELFFLAQLRSDSILNESEDENLLLEEEIIEAGIKKMTVQYKDSSQFKFKKSFYIQVDDE